MSNGASTSKHPFILEHVYREMADHVTGGDVAKPEAVLAPILDVYQSQRDELFKAVRKTASAQLREILDAEYDKPWWRLMPITLPPYRSNHEFALAYALYRLMTSGNMTFLVGKELSDALFNTDFSVRMDELYFPADTFTVYYKDASIPVFGAKLKYIFADRVDHLHGRKELRMVYGYIDEDGDYANSGFFLFNYAPDTLADSTNLFASIEDQDISELSKLPVKEMEKENSRNVLTALFNFLLYIGKVGDQTVVKPPDYEARLAKLTNPKKRRQVEKEMKKQSLFRYTYVGGSYEKRIGEAGGGVGQNLDHKVLVRGHWRYQWVGKQRDADGNRIPGTAQKLVWIEPYWKGPDVQDDKVTVRVVR